MPDLDKKPASRSDRTTARDAERKKRLAEALRENLRKRKAPKATQKDEAEG
ncbi:hypothetical protein [Methylopila sp. M107]|uniref:hypothetical protein n=1 Tax=Methylopila sp. M107 TaxID=1101190 RepID=UPI0003718295|nr:hypothetical protein [Methylopila sp. M107]